MDKEKARVKYLKMNQQKINVEKTIKKDKQSFKSTRDKKKINTYRIIIQIKRKD